MDPISVLGLAVNIITILDIAAKFVSEAREIYRHADGFTNETRDASEIATDIQALAVTLSRSQKSWLKSRLTTELDANEAALNEISTQCSRIAEELAQQLRRVARQGRIKSLASIRSALLLLWNHSELQDYKARLQMYREAMNSRVVLGIREHLNVIDRLHDQRFTDLDDHTKRVADAIVNQSNVFSVQLDMHTELLSQIRNGQDRTESLLIRIAAGRSPSPLLVFPQGDSDSRFPLHKAVIEEDMSAVRACLKRDSLIDVNSLDDQDRTALHYVKTADMAKRLIDAGARVSEEDGDGRTPLHHAVRHRRLEVVQTIISRSPEHDAKDDQGKTALDYAQHCPAAKWMLEHGWRVEDGDPSHFNPSGLFHMAWLGDMEGTRFFLKRGAKVDVRNAAKETALMEACRHGDTEIVKLLLDAGADKEATQEEGMTPLLIAVRENRIGTVRVLLSVGADVHATSSKNEDSLITASVQGHWEVARLLVEQGASLTTTENDHGNTPLHCAGHRANTAFTQFLIDKGAPLDSVNSYGHTVLLDAIDRKRNEQVRILLAAGANPVIASYGGFTPLSKAAEVGNAEAIKMLLKVVQRPSLPNDPSQNGSHAWTPIAEATHHRYLDCMQLLLDANVDLELKNWDMWQTPLHHAAREEESIPEAVNMLIAAGANLEPRDRNSATPLALAAALGNAACLQALIVAGADKEAISTVEKDGQRYMYTPLMRAVLAEDREDNVKTLVLAGAKLDARASPNGATALLLAAQECKWPVVKILLDAGADVNCADTDGITPLMEAAMSDDEAREAVSWMVVAGASRNARDNMSRTAWIHAKHCNTDSGLRDILSPDPGAA